jgi:hypothetical protein
LRGVNTPRFYELFFEGVGLRKRWIGAGFVSFCLRSWVLKMRFGGLTCDFAGENGKWARATAKTKAGPPPVAKDDSRKNNSNRFGEAAD